MQDLKNLFIGNDRLSSYKDLDDYCENIKYSQKFYSLLNVFEIALRNKINYLYSNLYVHNWISEFKNNQIVRPYLITQINEAINKIQKKKTACNNSDLVGALHFGFWVELFDCTYLIKNKLQIHQIHYIFGIKKALINKTNTQKIHKELSLIRDCRNRIFHHEKMLNHRNENYNNIEAMLHKYIYRIDENKFLESLLNKQFGIKLIRPTKL